MKKTVSIEDLDFEHKSWSNEISFQKSELKIFNQKLEKVVLQHNKKDVLKRVEYFQNHFIRHKEIIDILLHDIKIHQQNLSRFKKLQIIDIDNTQLREHIILRQKVETQEHLYKDLKTEFMRFLTKNE